jgi:hypothetical protein
MKHRKILVEMSLVKARAEDKDIYKYELTARKYWKELQEQFSTSELDLFKDYWTNIIAQFKGDVLATEELQIVDLIRYELLISRNLKEQKNFDDDIWGMEKLIKGERAKSPEDCDNHTIAQLTLQVSQARMAQSTSNTEHVKMQSEKNKLFKDLKSTRDQRIAKIEDQKVNIFQLFRALDDHHAKEQEARQSALFKLAADKERERLSQPHTYIDNNIDLPFLSADSVYALEEAIEKQNLEEEKHNETNGEINPSGYSPTNN